MCIVGMCIALVTHTSIYPVLLLAPMLKGMTTKQRIVVSASFGLVFGVITAANVAVYGTSWIRPTWGTM
jgi:hypothetical protein